MNAYATAYKTVNNTVDGENKPRLLLKAFQNILDRIGITKTAIRQNDFEKKFKELSKIKVILEVLDSSLDMSYGEIPKNLSSIYRYIIKRLDEVHRDCSLDTLDECKNLISTISEGFTYAFETEAKGRSAALQDGPARSARSSVSMSI